MPVTQWISPRIRRMSDLPIDITDVNSPPDVPLVDTRTSCVNEGGISPSPVDSSPVSEGDD
eukprot:scaffold134946_cov30-Cyclotella_meneghiniana.AAC.1